MSPTHIILSGPDGKRIEMTIDEARRLWRELGAALGMSQTQPVPEPEPYWAPLRPHWVSPGSADPMPPSYVVTCEVRG